MDVSKDHIWQLMTAQLSGNLSEEEQLQLKEWLAQNPQDALLFEDLQQLWAQTSESAPPASATEEQWTRLQADMQKVSYVPMVLDNAEGKSHQYFWWVVAGLVLVASLGFLYNITFSQGELPSSEVQAYGNLDPEEPQWSYWVDADSLWKVSLPDGSKVWLNRDARLYYGEGFNLQERQVKLVGEGYFEVKPDAARPFIITAGPSQTKVLGTSFNLKAKGDQASVQVVSGNVSFTAQNAEDELLLSAGETGQLNQSQLVKSRQSDTHYLDWKHALDYKYEISNPIDFLSDNFRTKRSAINQTLIDGVIHNHAELATYHNIKLRVQYYHGKKEKMKSYEFTVYQAVGPGQTIDYRYRLADWFGQTDAVEIKIVDASVIKN